MKRNMFIGIILVCLVVPLMFFGAYQLGVSSGFKDGEASMASQLNTPKGPSGSWVEGYNAGVLAAQNGATPTP
jgi:hypothetical protein